MSRFDPHSTTLISSGDRDRVVVEACDPADYAFRVEEAELEILDPLDDDNVTQEIFTLVDDCYVLA